MLLSAQGWRSATHSWLASATIWLCTCLLVHPGARLEVIESESRSLAANPLHDPVTRRVAVFVPDQYTNQTPLPIVYYLPGYDDSSDQFIKESDRWRVACQKLANDVTPALFVVVDGRNRWGGSQYLNSPAQGNYADYVCDEIVARVESLYSICTNHPQRIIAGNSSGGFGALRLGMMRHDLFDGVIALSPDSDFQESHLPLVKLPGVTNTSLAEIHSCMAPEMSSPPPQDGDLRYALGLSAAYAPVGPAHPGQFEWLYDENGRFRQTVWQRWLDHDPLTIVRRDRNAFAAGQSIYLEGAAQDQFLANIGARKIYETIHRRPARCTFYEPPGGHGDHLPDRLERGLAWIFHCPTKEIK